MTQESRLVIVIDSKNAERNAKALADEMSKISERGDSATQSTRDMGKQISVTNNIVQNFNTTVNNSNSTINKTAEVTKRVTQQNQQFSQTLKNTTQEIDKQEKKLNAYSTSIRALVGYMAGLITIHTAVNQMDAYTGLQNRLKLVTKDQVELNKATEDTFNIAQKTYSSLDSVLQVYQRFSDNAKTLNLTMDQTARLTETVSKAVAISGATAQSADAALVQFGQALASGTLRGEELNSVMEQTPALAKAIAQGMGITIGELRSVAAEGKITSEEIVKALTKVQGNVDELFGKTDVTIGQSLTLLSNEITKFIGEAGKGTGAAQLLSGSIQTLSENLNLIADIAILGGVAYLTKAIVTKTVAVNNSIISTSASRQVTIAKTQAEVAEATATLNAAKAHLANIRATNAEAQAKYGATAAALRYSQAQAAVTAATNAQTAAQARLTVVTSRFGSLATGALGLVGGPIGALTIGVTALAAGYMYLEERTAQANAKLAEQAKIVEKTDEQLKKLSGNDKKKAIEDLTATFEAQNKELKKTEQGVASALIEIQNYVQGNIEVTRISNEARLGTISYKEAIERLNAIKLPTDLYDKLKDQARQYDENAIKASQAAAKLKLFGVEVILAGNQAQNAVPKVKANTDELNSNAVAAEKASKAQTKYFESLSQDVLSANERLAYMNLGFSKEVIDQINKLQAEKQKALGEGVTAIVTDAEIKKIVLAQNALDAVKQKEDEIAEAKRNQTKELEKQQKILSVNAKVQANASKFGFSNIESKYRLPAGTLSAIHMIESRGNAKAYNKDTGATGGFQFLSGTAKQYGVKDRTDLAQSAEGAGKYMSYLLKLFKGDLEKAVRAYHAGEGNVQKGKGIGKYNNQYWKDFQGYMAGINGYSAGDISSKDFTKMLQDGTKMAEEQARLRVQLENEVADQQTKIRNDLAQKLEEVDKANFSPERKAEIVAELKARADIDIAIAQQALRTKLDDYKEFQKTEAELLEESFARKKFNAAHDIELSKVEQKQAVELLEQQYQQELGLMQLAQEQRLFQAKLVLLSETEAMQERYRLEREEILKNTKLSIEERQKQITFSKASQEKEMRDKITGAVDNWGGIQADMNGYGDFYRQDQDRFSRLGAAQDLFDSKSAAVDYNEQNGIDDINTKLQAGLLSQQDFEDQKTAIMQAALEQRNLIYDEYSQNAQAIEDKYQQDRLNAQIALGGQMIGSVTSMFGSMFGEQSKAYKVMFAADKAYAIAAAGIAIQQNIAQAAKIGFPQNLPLIAGAIAQGANIISNIRAIKDQGFAEGGYTGKGGKYEVAGSVHKGEIVWSQDDIKRWGGVNLVESMRKSSNPEAFLKNNSADNIMRRALMSSNAFMESQKKSDIFNQAGDGQIIYKANQTAETPKISTGSDLYHDGKVYFSPKGLVQDRSNLEDVHDFTLGRSARPEAEAIASVQPSAPTINFKIEVLNQAKGVAVEAEQLDENTVRLIVKDELDKTLPREVPKIVSDQIKEPSSPISRAISTNTTARRNR